jgi:anti-sigma factor RsiW
MLKCREVEQKIGSGEIASAGFMERLAVNFHLMMCRHCRAYARQIRAIGAAAREVFGSSLEEPKALSELKDRIMKR